MKPETKREVLIAREAVRRTCEDQWPAISLSYGLRPWNGWEAVAKKLFPLPKVTRPRVVEDPVRGTWRVVDGGLCHRQTNGIYDPGSLFPTPARLAIWNDLMAHPTEEVEVE